MKRGTDGVLISDRIEQIHTIFLKELTPKARAVLSIEYGLSGLELGTRNQSERADLLKVSKATYKKRLYDAKRAISHHLSQDTHKGSSLANHQLIVLS